MREIDRIQTRAAERDTNQHRAREVRAGEFVVREISIYEALTGEVMSNELSVEGAMGIKHREKLRSRLW